MQHLPVLCVLAVTVFLAKTAGALDGKGNAIYTRMELIDILNAWCAGKPYMNSIMKRFTTCRQNSLVSNSRRDEDDRALINIFSSHISNRTTRSFKKVQSVQRNTSKVSLHKRWRRTQKSTINRSFVRKQIKMKSWKCIKTSGTVQNFHPNLSLNWMKTFDPAWRKLPEPKKKSIWKAKKLRDENLVKETQWCKVILFHMVPRSC